MCDRPRNAMYYYLELVDGVWEARDHWGRLLCSHKDKAESRKDAERQGYFGFK